MQGLFLLFLHRWIFRGLRVERFDAPAGERDARFIRHSDNTPHRSAFDSVQNFQSFSRTFTYTGLEQ